MVGSGNTKSARVIAVPSANSPAPNQTTRVRSCCILRMGAVIPDAPGLISVINSGPPAHVMLMTAAEPSEVTHKRRRASH